MPLGTGRRRKLGEPNALRRVQAGAATLPLDADGDFGDNNAVPTAF